MALTKDILDRMECQDPHCKHESCEIWFHSNCHFDSPMWFSYEKGSGILVIRCAKCDKVVCEVAVANPMEAN